MKKLTKTVKCKLVLNDMQFNSVKNTLAAFNNACNDILKISAENRTKNKFRIQKLCYHDIKNRYRLPANLVVRAIARVSASKKPKTFNGLSFDLDARTFSFKNMKASMSSISGRLKGIPIDIGDYQRNMLDGKPRPLSAKIVYNKKHKCFFIHIAVDYIVKDIVPSGNIIGIDRGVYNIAYTTGELKFSGKQVMHKRKQNIKIRASLQAKGTKGSKKLLKRLGGKEKRWMTDVNHNISRQIADNAGNGDMLILEDLKYIRERLRLAKKQRTIVHSWAFAQLQAFIEYKSLEKGAVVVYVDPRYTSQRCSECGFVHRSNRNSHKFICKACGYTANADYNASRNIRQVYLDTLADGVMSKTPKASPETAVASPCL